MLGWWSNIVQDQMRPTDFAYQRMPMAAAARSESSSARQKSEASNLQYDPNARIQTGPAEPEWSWNYVSCSWDSPVSATQRVTPVLISLGVHRLLTAVRLTLLVILVAILFGAGTTWKPFCEARANSGDAARHHALAGAVVRPDSGTADARRPPRAAARTVRRLSPCGRDSAGLVAGKRKQDRDGGRNPRGCRRSGSAPWPTAGLVSPVGQDRRPDGCRRVPPRWLPMGDRARRRPPCGRRGIAPRRRRMGVDLSCSRRAECRSTLRAGM